MLPERGLEAIVVGQKAQAVFPPMAKLAAGSAWAIIKPSLCFAFNFAVRTVLALVPGTQTQATCCICHNSSLFCDLSLYAVQWQRFVSAWGLEVDDLSLTKIFRLMSIALAHRALVSATQILLRCAVKPGQWYWTKSMMTK